METNTPLTDTESKLELKSASFPVTATVKPKVKKQISSPSYLRSLAENDLPPFKPALPEPRPQIICEGPGQLMSADQAIDMIAMIQENPRNGLRKYLNALLVEKQVTHNYGIVERNFLISLMDETVNYAAQRDFSANKLSCLISIYLSSHLYFKSYYWTAPLSIWNYFKELMIRHSINDSPDGEEVFEPEECYDILTHFHTMYITNLPLIHLSTYGAYNLKLCWPFKRK